MTRLSDSDRNIIAEQEADCREALGAVTEYDLDDLMDDLFMAEMAEAEQDAEQASWRANDITEPPFP